MRTSSYFLILLLGFVALTGTANAAASYSSSRWVEPKAPKPKPFVQEEDVAFKVSTESDGVDGKPVWSNDDAEPYNSELYWHGKSECTTPHNAISHTHLALRL